ARLCERAARAGRGPAGRRGRPHRRRRRLRGRVPHLARRRPRPRRLGPPRDRARRDAPRWPRAMRAVVGTVDGVYLVDLEDETIMPLDAGEEPPPRAPVEISLPLLVDAAVS